MSSPGGALGPIRRLEPSKTKSATATYSGMARLAEPGVHALGYTARPAYTELGPVAFRKYLEAEGLDAIVRERAKRKEMEEPGRESYARSCKALVRVGSELKGFDQRIGLPIEITPLEPPFPHRDEPVGFRVQKNGAPLADALVDLLWIETMEAVQQVRTDAKGEVRLLIPRPGRWLVATTVMSRASPRAKEDWVSLWGSLFFES